MPTFNMKWDYQRFLKTTLYYQLEGPKPRFSIFDPRVTDLARKERIVDIICYCFMPNHFHLLLKQRRAGGITEFMAKLTNSYTKYFNMKNKRVGPLFQGEFKAVHIETDDQLIHLSRYIHLNPIINYVSKDLDSYQWSSYSEYIRESNGVCDKDIVLGQFNSIHNYKQFVLDQESYARELKFIKHQLLDLEEN